MIRKAAGVLCLISGGAQGLVATGLTGTLLYGVLAERPPDDGVVWALFVGQAVTLVLFSLAMIFVGMTLLSPPDRP